jgi:hypothetical protein
VQVEHEKRVPRPGRLKLTGGHVAKNNRNHSNSLDIPAQLRRRLIRFPDRRQQLTVEKSETESCVMIGSRDLEQRIRFESACRSMTSVDTFFTPTGRA